MSASKSHKVFWPDMARLVISISMQFETGAQPDRGAGGPFLPIDPKYPDLPVQKWYEYGFNTIRNNDIVRFDSPATTNAGCEG